MTEEGDSKVEISSYNQSGGITAQNVTINNVSSIPSPEIRAQLVYYNKSHEGEFQTRINLSLISPYAVGNLYIEVRAKTIKSIDCMPIRSGGWMEGLSGKRDGYAFTNMENAYGEYELHIITEQEENNIEIFYRIG